MRGMVPIHHKVHRGHRGRQSAPRYGDVPIRIMVYKTGKCRPAGHDCFPQEPLVKSYRLRELVVLFSLLAASGLTIRAQPGQQPGSQQSEGATIKVETALVTFPVSVLDKNGKFIPHLMKSDFHIYEDNIEQEIASFADVEAPFNVVLLLDTSRSTRFKIEDIQRAAIAFVNKLRPDDRVMIVSFDSDIYIDSEFTSDREVLRRAIRETHTGGSTRLYDAVDLVITERLSRVQGRKAIVLFTDGVDTASQLATDRSTLARVDESGVLVYPV